jgi:hypothetical protein
MMLSLLAGFAAGYALLSLLRWGINQLGRA